MTSDSPDAAATIAQHRATAAELRRKADSNTDDTHQRAYLTTAALAYETIANQLELSENRAKEITLTGLRLRAEHRRRTDAKDKPSTG
jgi:predicted RNase H-like nuclease (RuvC/YqgF family)